MESGLSTKQLTDEHLQLTDERSMTYAHLNFQTKLLC